MIDSNSPAAPIFMPPARQGRHDALLKRSFPPWLIDASNERKAELKSITPDVPHWYSALSKTQISQLKSLFELRFVSQNKWDQHVSALQSAQAFAQPLLEAALKTAGYNLPVNDVHIRLYTPAVDAFGVKTGGHGVRTMSLLQAALHNFESPETQAHYFADGSGFITRPDEYGRFNAFSTSLTIEAFAQLCRELDIGAHYLAHLQTCLDPQGAVSQGILEHRYITQQKAMLKLDAYIALLKGDIDADGHSLMQRVINGERNISVGEQQLWLRTPSVMGILLHGCVVFSFSEQYRYVTQLIVWIPGDPEHPLKGYDSYDDFRDELVRKLTARSTTLRQTGFTPYQAFLSRFIQQSDRPYFYKGLTDLVKDAPDQPWGVEWFRSENTQFWVRALAAQVSLAIFVPPNPEAHTRRVQAEHPSIKVSVTTMNGEEPWVDLDLWSARLKEMRTLAFANAPATAVPTALADANNYSLRTAHYLNIGLFALNLVSMVIPPLGDVMMVVMVSQLLGEIIEGVHDWVDGEREAAWAHISDVLQNIATLAVGAGVFHVASPIIESLKKITLPNGKQRLWNADLRPYEHTIDISPDALPDESGIYSINGQKVLPLDGKTYVLEFNPVTGHYSALHPFEPEAYKPEFKHSGHGVWVAEDEQPLTWKRRTLKRRLGLLTTGLLDRELELMLNVCEVRGADLRRMYAEGEPIPVLLLESLRQYQAYAKARKAVQEVRAARMSFELCSYAAAFTVEMPGWPASKAIDVFDSRHLNRQVTRYGSAQAAQADVITLNWTQLMAGELPGRVVDALSLPQLETLMGNRAPLTREDRLNMFKELLSEHMENNIQRLFASLSEAPITAGDSARPAIELIKRLFPSLSTTVVRRLLAQASADEIKRLATGRVPLRLLELARIFQRNTRLSSAYVGLFLDGLVKADTEILVLNTLKNLTGWRRDLRLEVREGDFTGVLRASIGARDSNHRKVLARISDGKYRALDEEGNHLSSVCDFYSSLQHALPDNYRKALGVPHVNQDRKLKKMLTRHALPRAQLQRLLKIKPEARPFFLPPRRLVSGKLGYLLSGTGVLAQDDAQAAAMKVRLGRLYPAFTYGDINGFFQLHGARAPLRLQALEVEFESLDTTLWQWVYSPIDGEPVSVNPNPIQQRTLGLRHQVRERLEHAWRRSGTQHFDSAGQYLGQHLSFSLEGMGPILQSLPQLGTPFSHVSKLNVSGAAVTDAIGVFLSHFKQLRELDVAGASLTHLPSAITDMSFLERLNLKGNAIVLTPQTGARLRGLTRLRELNLENCPLGLPPDISRMPDLSRLTLTHCNLDRWPVGLLAHARAREFRLYLDKNPLSHIPDVAPGSDKAATVARTYLSVDDVSREVLERYNLYSESVGIERPRLLPAGVESDSRHWISGLSPDQVATHQALWNLVEEQPGSGPFFDVLRDQARHFELRTDAFKQDLRGKVWRMLEAITQSAELRDTLFEMAAAPFFCVDAGAQLFNAMGVEVLLHEAYSGPAAEVGGEILALAKGKVRLDELGRIARARVRELEAQGRQHPEYDASGQRVIHLDSQGRRVRDIDEVEIYLTYTAQLAERLNLPWQYPEMAFPEADVTPAMVERAYVRVKALDEGDLVDQLLDQPIWTEYVKGAHASAFASVRERILALTELQVAQRDWVEGVGLTEQQRAELRTTIEAAGRLLGKSSDEVAPGRLMSNMVYDIAMDALVAEEREVMYDLTASVSRPSLDSIWGYSDSDSDV